MGFGGPREMDLDGVWYSLKVELSGEYLQGAGSIADLESRGVKCEREGKDQSYPSLSLPSCPWNCTGHFIVNNK